MRAAIYVRVSTTKDSQKDSPEHQIAACKYFAEDMGWETAEDMIYEDRESGTNITDRLAIQQALKDAHQGAFQVIIFAALSRFARDIGDSINLKRKLVNALRIRLISIDDHYDSDRDDEMLFSIISSINQSLSEQISRSTRRGKRESALKGNFTGNRPPYGYDKETRNGLKTLVPNENQKMVVETIFQLYTANHFGEKSIAAYLNDQGIPSPKDGKWGITTIQRILQNEAYVGKNRSSKFEIRKVYTNVDDMTERKKVLVQKPKREWRYAHNSWTHQGIIDEATFRLAENLRLQRGGGQRGGPRQKVNVFAGMMKCAHCGSSMVSMKSTRRIREQSRRDYRYLICSRRRRQGESGCCNNYWLPYDPFHEDLIQCISQILRSTFSPEELLEKHKRLVQVTHTDLESEMKKRKKWIIENRKCLMELRKERLKGHVLDEHQYELEKSHYEREIVQHESRLIQLQQEWQRKTDMTDLYEKTMERLNDLLNVSFETFDDSQLTLKKLISRIEADRQGNVHVFMTFD
ncbi:recombinase family protein [Paenibacillus selenitireducens]|nr:recombinase family protein [Paenibacillus selenitireducens]